MHTIRTLLMASFLLANFSLFAQTEDKSEDEKEQAMEIAREAIKLMDEGEYEESIEILEEAKTLDSTNYIFDYEIGYAHFLQEDNNTAIDILEAVIEDYDTIGADLYQLLGNVYDFKEKPKEAIRAYKEGLEMFPNAGRLYLELGVVEAFTYEDFD